MATKVLRFRQFNAIYQPIVGEVYRFWTPELQESIAAHNCDWGSGRYDFAVYLQASAIRFYRAYRAIAATGAQTVCDIGGFWGVFPLALKKIGYDVTMTEKLAYYDRSFDPLFNFIAGRGVTILDADPFEPKMTATRRYDGVTVMAVLEHYPHSLRCFMENIAALLKEHGMLYIEVPNIAYWPKRVAFLRGRSPLVTIESIYKSKTPFIGHHHEFTLAELRKLVTLSGMRVIAESAYNYTDYNMPLRYHLRYPLQSLMYIFSKTSRECLAISCVRN